MRSRRTTGAEGSRAALRIALVSEHASPLAVLGGVDAGGQNVHVDALARALADRGHRVRVYTRRDDRALPDTVRLGERLEVVHVDAGPPESLPKDALLPHMPAFATVLTREWSSAGGARPDLVHAHFWMSALAAGTAARATGLPLAVTFHALGSVKARHQGAADTSPACRVALETAIAREADAVLATCRDEVRELSALGVPVDRMHIVPCGVDTAAFGPDGPGSAACGDRPDRGRLRLLCVGRLVERKGVDDAIRALALIRSGPRPVDAELLVVGGPVAGALDDDEEARRLARLARRLGVADRVRLLGRVRPADLPAHLRAADIVVAPPWYEPFGIVPLEAMATGRPVVGSAVGGLLDTVLDLDAVPDLDTVPDGATGVLVPPRDPAALAAALERLAADPQLRERLGRAGRRRSLDYDWSRVAARTEDVYRQVLRGRDPEPLGRSRIIRAADPATPDVETARAVRS